jgi:hypothetical protein
VGLQVPAEPIHLLAQVGLRVPLGPTHLLAQQLGKQGFFFIKKLLNQQLADLAFFSVFNFFNFFFNSWFCICFAFFLGCFLFCTCSCL